MAALCEICTSIPLDNLPPFPREQYAHREVTKFHLRKIFVQNPAQDPRSSPPPETAALGFRYHEDRGGLWQSAAAGRCDLCVLVEWQAKLVLGDFEELNREGRDPTHGARPNFDLWITRPPEDDGSGGSEAQVFWVLSKTKSKGESNGDATAGMVIPIAAVKIVRAATEQGARFQACPIA